jgi:Family of unknown function (DUF6299)
MTFALGVLLAACVGSWSSTANAQTFLKFTSEPGDYIGGGQTATFTPTDSGFNTMISSDNREIAIHISPSSSFWSLHLTAPSGTKLLPGVYEGATRWPFQAAPTPGLDFSGDGRGCNTLTGKFEVLEAVYAPFGYVERFHATFEQHCEGSTPALLGEVQIVNPPPPPPLTIDLTVDRKGKVQRASGSVTIGGTMQCSQAAAVQLTGTVTQRASRLVLITGSFSTSVQCSSTPTSWTARVAAQGTPFNPGAALVDVTASAVDPNFGVPVIVQNSALIRLEGGKR